MTDREKIAKTYRLTPAAVDLIEKLRQRLGVDRQDVLELAVREFAQKHGMAIKARGK